MIGMSRATSQLLDRSRGSKPVHDRHLHVQQDDVYPGVFLQLGERFNAAVGEQNPVFLRQQRLQGNQVCVPVVYDQNGGLGDHWVEASSPGPANLVPTAGQSPCCPAFLPRCGASATIARSVSIGAGLVRCASKPARARAPGRRPGRSRSARRGRCASRPRARAGEPVAVEPRQADVDQRHVGTHLAGSLRGRSAPSAARAHRWPSLRARLQAERASSESSTITTLRAAARPRASPARARVPRRGRDQPAGAR